MYTILMAIRRAQDMARGLLKRGFVRDVLTLQAGSVAGMAINFIKSVALFRFLGTDDYGLLAVTMALIGTVTIFINLGQGNATVTFLAEAYHKKDMLSIRRVYRYFMELAVCANIIILAFIAFAPAFIEYMYDTTAITGLARIALLTLLVGSFDSLTISTLQVVREIRLLTTLENLSLLLQVTFGVALLIPFGVTGALTGFLIGTAIMSVVYLFTFARIRKRYHLPGLGEAFRGKLSTKEYVWQGLWIAIDRNVGNLFPQGFLFIMSLFTTPAAVGIAQLAITNANRPRTVLLPHVGRMANSVLPAVASEGPQKLRRAVAQLIKHTLLVHTSITVACMLVFPWLLILVYGDAFRPAIEPMLWIMLISIISGFNIANAPILRLFRKAHVSALFNAIVMPLELLLFVGLLKIFEPLNALVLILLVIYVMGLWLNWFMYRTIKHEKPSTTSPLPSVE